APSAQTSGIASWRDSPTSAVREAKRKHQGDPPRGRQRAAAGFAAARGASSMGTSAGLRELVEGSAVVEVLGLRLWPAAEHLVHAEQLEARELFRVSREHRGIVRDVEQRRLGSWRSGDG